MPKTDESFDPSAYATVAQRIALFYRSHPNGRILTELINRDESSVTFKASVYRAESDVAAAATGWATEREGDGDINTVACLENTETSAIGRALANLGFTASIQRPSVEEMRKAARARRTRAVAREGRVCERSPEYAHVAADLLTVLGEAERAGLPHARCERLRVRIERDVSMTVEEMQQKERSLRDWLHRLPDRARETM